MNLVFKLFVVFVLTHVSEGVFRCDYKYDKINKVWIKYHNIPVVWQDAKLMCAYEGGILASPISDQMRNNMASISSRYRRYLFTGFHSTYSKGKFYTIDGIPLDTIPHHWQIKEPDNKQNNESCLAIDAHGLLYDVSCDEPLPYICFRNKSKTRIGHCGTDDPGYRKFHHRCYKFHNEPRTFAYAHLVCSAEGGYLVIVNDHLEFTAIDAVVQAHYLKFHGELMPPDSYYIGIHTSPKSGDWRTIHGQTLPEAGYEKWEDEFRPDRENFTESVMCGTIAFRSYFKAVSCEEQLAFICEKIPSYPPICDKNGQKVLTGRRHLKQKMASLNNETSTLRQINGSSILSES